MAATIYGTNTAALPRFASDRTIDPYAKQMAIANAWKPAPAGPYQSEYLNTRLAEAKAWLKERGK